MTTFTRCAVLTYLSQHANEIVLVIWKLYFKEKQAHCQLSQNMLQIILWLTGNFRILSPLLRINCLFPVIDSKCLDLFQCLGNNFQHFSSLRLWWVILTTSYHLMLQTFGKVSTRGFRATSNFRNIFSGSGTVPQNNWRIMPISELHIVTSLPASLEPEILMLEFHR